MTNIYIITNKLNGKQYVGKTVKSIEERFKEHCRGYLDNHTYIDCAIHCYGEENFSVELIRTCEDSEWKYWESKCIEDYHTHWTCGGYNLSRGGDNNPMDDEEVRRRHKIAVNRPERLEAIRKKSLGRKHTIESQAKMSEIQKKIYSDPDLVRKVKLGQPNRFSVDMLDDAENVLATFDTLGDACTYCGKARTNAGCLKAVVDKYNQNGRRAKFWGYCWSKHIDKV